jgi:hypothetical protein
MERTQPVAYNLKMKRQYGGFGKEESAKGHIPSGEEEKRGELSSFYI